MKKNYPYHPLVLSAIIAIMTDDFYAQGGSEWADPRFQDEVDSENPPSEVTIVCNEGHKLPEQDAVDLKVAELERPLLPRYRPVDIVGLVNAEFGINLPMLLTGTVTAATKLVNALLSTINLYTETGVNPDDPLFTSGLDGLVQVGVFTAEQRAQIVPLIKQHLTPIR